MDKQYIAQRLKKYLFLISIIFIVLTTSHLIYSYIYNDAKETAIRGGTISEALIGATPSLNPLKNGSSSDKYLNHILYRSLLTYDIKNKKIVPDLAKCDTRNLLKIECFLNTNIKWSNGEDIVADDVIATFETLKNTQVNHNMTNLLKNIEIKKTNTSIIFNNTKKDINILKIFFQPIVSKKILNIISKKEIEGDFSLSSGLYSGKYKVSNILKNESSNITTITLEKNKQYYKNSVYIETILLKIFPNVAEFLKNKNSINVFNDKNNLISGDIPKLGEHKYILPQYVSVFLNTKRIKNNDLRAFLLNKIDRDEIIKKLGEKNYKKINNPFLEDIYIENKYSNKNISQILKEEGYYKKENLIKLLEEELNLEKNNLPKISGEATIRKKRISEEANIIEKKETVELTAPIEIKNPKSKIIFSPSWVEKYNFITRNKYYLKIKIDNNINSVFINDDKITDLKSNSKEIVYEISEKKGNLKLGENKYNIYFEKDGKKELIEEVNFYLEKNKEKLKKAEKKFFEKKIEEIKLKQQNKSVKTTKLQKTEKYTQIEKKIEKIKNLEDNYFYNKDLEIFNLELYYISSKVDLQLTAEYIKNNFAEKGIKVNIRQISPKDINQLIISGKKNYDIILTGINLSYFNFNIYSYYHSSGIEKGYNLSNFRKLDLDIALEELKSNILEKDKYLILEKKVLEIIKDNNLSKTIYTPILSNLVDKNIKGYHLENKIPEDIYRFEPFYKSYVNKSKTITLENKNISGYVKFIVNTLFK